MQETKPDTHGHEVMDMMRASGKRYSRKSLLEDIHAKFGTHATFCTCAAEGMDAEQLIDFLEVRGKFVQLDGGFQLAAAENCDHH